LAVGFGCRLDFLRKIATFFHFPENFLFYDPHEPELGLGRPKAECQSSIAFIILPIQVLSAKI
jgi:hypothetical protein